MISSDWVAQAISFFNLTPEETKELQDVKPATDQMQVFQKLIELASMSTTDMGIMITRSIA